MEHKGLRPLINPGFFRQSHAASRAAQKTILSPARREAISMGAGAFCTPGSSALAGFRPWDTGLCCPCATRHSPRRQLSAEHGFLPAIVHGRGKTPFSFALFSPALRPPGCVPVLAQRRTGILFLRPCPVSHLLPAQSRPAKVCAVPGPFIRALSSQARTPAA